MTSLAISGKVEGRGWGMVLKREAHNLALLQDFFFLLRKPRNTQNSKEKKRLAKFTGYPGELVLLIL